MEFAEDVWLRVPADRRGETGDRPRELCNSGALSITAGYRLANQRSDIEIRVYTANAIECRFIRNRRISAHRRMFRARLSE